MPFNPAFKRESWKLLQEAQSSQNHDWIGSVEFSPEARLDGILFAPGRPFLQMSKDNALNEAGFPCVLDESEFGLMLHNSGEEVVVSMHFEVVDAVGPVDIFPKFACQKTTDNVDARLRRGTVSWHGDANQDVRSYTGFIFSCARPIDFAFRLSVSVRVLTLIDYFNQLIADEPGYPGVIQLL